jgi:HD-like signal output (HDOD) protein
LTELAGLIRRDSALTADLLALGNSALFGRGERCTDVFPAIQRLGLREVLRVLSLSLSKNLFGQGLSNYRLTAQQYWNASMLAALLMDTLARRYRADPDEAYIVGILHAIGRVLINEVLRLEGWSTIWDGSFALEFWELQEVGFTYAVAGALLLRRWSFPEAIWRPIRGQLDPLLDVRPNTSAGLLRLGVLLLSRFGSTTGLCATPAPLTKKALAWAGWETEAEANQLVSAIRARHEEVMASLPPAWA